MGEVAQLVAEWQLSRSPPLADDAAACVAWIETKGYPRAQSP